jgi:hypothetical protein
MVIDSTWKIGKGNHKVYTEETMMVATTSFQIGTARDLDADMYIFKNGKTD